MYQIYKLWHNGGKQLIEETSDGNYANKRVLQLNEQIDFKHKGHPLKYLLEIK